MHRTDGEVWDLKRMGTEESIKCVPCYKITLQQYTRKKGNFMHEGFIDSVKAMCKMHCYRKRHTRTETCGMSNIERNYYAWNKFESLTEEHGREWKAKDRRTNNKIRTKTKMHLVPCHSHPESRSWKEGFKAGDGVPNMYSLFTFGKLHCLYLGVSRTLEDCLGGNRPLEAIFFEAKIQTVNESLFCSENGRF